MSDITIEAQAVLSVHATSVLKACVVSQRAIDAQAVKTSDLILNLFKECLTASEFKTACTAAEGTYKAKQIKASKDDSLPRCWTQAKSDLIGAAKAGINVLEMASVSQAKREKIKVGKAKTEAAKQHAKTGKAEEDTSHTSSTSNKYIQLGEKLGTLSESMREAMLDAFLVQIDRATQASSPEFDAAMGDVQYKALKDVTPVAKTA